jgi:hypothetical protein
VLKYSGRLVDYTEVTEGSLMDGGPIPFCLKLYIPPTPSVAKSKAILSLHHQYLYEQNWTITGGEYKELFWKGGKGILFVISVQCKYFLVVYFGNII